MRRTLATTATALLAVLALAAPVHAADQTVVIRSLDLSGKPYQISYGLSCDGTHYAQFSQGLLVRITSTNPSPTLGTRSWGWYLNSQPGNFVGPGVEVTSSADLDTLKVSLFGPATDARAAVFASPAGTPAGQSWLGLATATVPASHWTVVDGAALTYTWTLVQEDQNGNLQPTGTTSPAASIKDFVIARGDGKMAAFIGSGCSGQDFYYDNFEYGATGNVTTLDFEAVPFQGTLSPTSATITAGQASKLSLQGNVVSNDPAHPGFVLQMKPYGATTWSAVPGYVFITDSGGAWSGSFKPTKQTSYRVYFKGADSVQAGYSTIATVKVKTALTIGLVDTIVHKGRPLVVKGLSNPHKPGVVVTLWRKTSTGSVKLATSKVTSTGAYKISYIANHTGSWTLYTTIAAASGNLAGRSVNRTAKVVL